MRTVLLPTDFSKGANAAMRRALQLPLGRGARVVLLHVLPSFDEGGYRKSVEDAAWMSLRKAEARALKLAKDHQRSDLEVCCELELGEIVPAVARVAKQEKADLIVLGRRPAVTLKETLRGEKAQLLARANLCPVLVVAQASDRPYREVLCALDLQGGAPEVIQKTAQLVPRKRTPLFVLHAYEHDMEPYLRQVSATLKQLESYRIRCRREALDKAQAALLPLGADRRRVRVLLHPDEPTRAIVDTALRRQSDLVVLGVHKGVGPVRMLLTSVASHTFRRLHRDVLLVPLPARRKAVDVAAFSMVEPPESRALLRH